MSLQFSGVAGEKQQAPRGIVIILADDLGFGDIGAYGATHVRTPVLDQMAEGGVRLTDFHVPAAQCTPARAALLTGLYPERIGMERVVFPGSDRRLPDDRVTLAELLRRRGYRTHMVGKWHLGDGPGALPTHHGFETYFGFPYSHDMSPKVIIEGEKVVAEDVPPETLTGLWTDRAIKILEGIQADERFFLYLAHTAPHGPLGASEAFAGKSAFGAYGDTVEELDAAVGRVLQVLADRGLADDTLVLFMSDNGPFQPWAKPDPNVGGYAAPFRGAKAAAREGGLRVPFIARWPGVLPAGEVRTELATMLDIWPTIEELTSSLTNDETVPSVDGESIWTGLQATEAWHHGPVAFYHYGRLEAVREGPWKLTFPRQREWDWPFAYRYDRARAVQLFGSPDEVLPQLLTDLTRDPGETIDYSPGNADLVRRLEALAVEFRAELGDVRFKP